MRRLRVVAAACLVLVVSGCVPDAGIPTLPPTPTVTPVFASDEEALGAAEDAYAAYLEMSDLIGSEGGADPERIDTVAAGELRDVARKGFDDFRDNAWSTVGSTTLVALVPQFVDATAPEREQSSSRMSAST